MTKHVAVRRRTLCSSNTLPFVCTALVVPGGYFDFLSGVDCLNGLDSGFSVSS